MGTLAWYDGVVHPLHVIIQYNECCLLFQWNIYRSHTIYIYITQVLDTVHTVCVR